MFSDEGKITSLFVVPKDFKTVRQQYYYFRWFYPDDVLIFQVGRFYEFYPSSDDNFGLRLGLQRMRPNRRGAGFGFPVFSLNYYCQKILQFG